MAIAKSRVDGDFHVTGGLTCGSMNIPSGTVNNDDVAPGAGIEATKLQQQYAIHYEQADGADVESEIKAIHIVYGATATIVAVKVACLDAPSGSGGDKKFTVDLKKVNAASPSPATVLTSVVTIDNTVADCEVESGVINAASLVVGDTLIIDVAASGSSGDQGQGLVVTVILKEDPQ